MIVLRKYQDEAVTAVVETWQQGTKTALIVMPTGCGKTVVFSAVVNESIQKKQRVLILAHRGELLNQATEKLSNMYGIDSAIEKGSKNSLESNASVVVASVQTLCKQGRLDKFDSDYFDVIIVDETHHCMSNSYQRILSHFENANVLGVTATPERGDGQSIMNYFEKVAYEYSMEEAIRDGYLAPVLAKVIPIELNLYHVKTTAGDYNPGDVSDLLSRYFEAIAKELVRWAKDRKTVVFLPQVSTAQTFCEILKNHGLNAVEINGKTNNRDEILSDFQDGKYDIICNTMLLTEGWDCPSVDCVVVLRPTKMKGLYQQMVGRGMRLFPNKKNLLLLDFLWKSKKNAACSPASLVSVPQKYFWEVKKRIQNASDGLDVMSAYSSVKESREKNLVNALENANRDHKYGPVEASECADLLGLTEYHKTSSSAVPPTRKLLKELRVMDVQTDSIETDSQGIVLLQALTSRGWRNLATPKQLRLLNGYGFKNLLTWLNLEASEVISKIKNNGWVMPEDIDPEQYCP